MKTFQDIGGRSKLYDSYFSKIQCLNESYSGNSFVTYPPIFVSPGLNRFLVRYNSKFYLKQQILDVRDEKITPDFLKL